MCAAESLLLLVEGQDVALQVEGGGVGAMTAVSRTQKHQPGFGVNVLVLLQEPPISERLLTFVTLHPHCTHIHHTHSLIIILTERILVFLEVLLLFI